MAELDGFCQFQTLLILDSENFNQFKDQHCDPPRATQFKKFLDKIEPQLRRILEEIMDKKLANKTNYWKESKCS